MKKQTTKQFYNCLLQNLYTDTNSFLLSISNLEHVFWGCCRDFTKDILMKSNHWQWLGYRVDDFALICEKDIVSKLDKWSKTSTISKYSDDIELTINWLFDRHTNTLKNLFDVKYKNNIQNSYIVDTCQNELHTEDKLYKSIEISDFIKSNDLKKVKVLKTFWENNLFADDFDLQEMEYLCQKYSAPPPSTFLNLKNVIKSEMKQNENGNSQLVFIF